MFVVGEIRSRNRGVEATTKIDRHLVREMGGVDDRDGDGAIGIDVRADVDILNGARGLDADGARSGEAEV